MRTLRAVGLAGVLALTGALALAADEARKEDKKDDKKLDDATFFLKAAAGNMLEMKAGEWAQKVGGDEVAKFGKMMVTDHAKAQDELLKIGQGKGMRPPADLPAEQKATAETLAKLTGKDFDKAYAKAMVESHTKGLDMYESFIKEGKDEALVGYAKKTAPTVKHHLEMAKQLEGKLK